MGKRTWLAMALASMGVLAGCSPGKVDADGDGRSAGEDCDDTSARVWRTVERYADADRDGFGAGELQRLCVGDPLPQGLSEKGGDCAPDDATRWRSLSAIFRDADEDGVTVGGPLTVCVGQKAAGYASTASAVADCDDSNPEVFREVALYPDTDGDGLGAGSVERRCIGAQVPQGHATLGTDCAPEDGSRWQLLSFSLRDLDNDGRTVTGSGEVCGGASLPAGYPTVANGEDCDDADASRWRSRTAYVDTDRDGSGSGALVERCMGDTLEVGYAETGGDCAPEDAQRWQAFSYSFRDQDLDGATVAEQGVVCGAASLPKGYAWGASGADCDDTNPSVLKTWEVFRDEDLDGVGSGSLESLCAGPTVPAGYSTSGTDCAASDVGRWRLLAYQHRDADEDGYTVPEQGSVCAGQALPTGYANVQKGPDCDDTEAAVHEGFLAYEDSDRDGVGAGDAVPQCTDGTVPAGYSRSGTDCAPTEPSQWQTLAYAHVDLDEDGHTTPSLGEVCSGTALPPRHYTVATGNDCDDADPALFRWTALYADQDADGVGAGPRTVPCLGDALPVGLSRFGYDVDDTNAVVIEDADEDEQVELILHL